MRGPYSLSHHVIDKAIGRDLRGIFVLGKISARGFLRRVDVLGRSDDDLARELKRHVGRHEGFLFQPVSSPVEAFHMECEFYHQLKRVDFPHPVRPVGTTLDCALCGVSQPEVTQQMAAERAKVYRSKAEEIRTAAETMHPETTGSLLRLAHAYERLAKTMEKMVELEPKGRNEFGD